MKTHLKTHYKKYLIGASYILAFVLGMIAITSERGVTLRKNWHDLTDSRPITAAAIIMAPSEKQSALIRIKSNPAFSAFVDDSAETVYLHDEADKKKNEEKQALDAYQSLSLKQEVQVTRASDRLNAMLGNENAKEHVTAMENINVK